MKQPLLPALLAFLPHPDVGQGPSLVETIPLEWRSTDCAARPESPRIAPGFHQLVTSNEWWSPLIWPFPEAMRYRGSNLEIPPLFPHPLAFLVEKDGFVLGYPADTEVAADRFAYPFRPEMALSVEGVERFSGVRSYSDWAVTAAWGTETRGMDATFGHGFPFVYMALRGDAGVKVGPGTACTGSWQILSNEGPVAAVNACGHFFGLFAPTDVTWKTEGDGLRTDIPPSFLSVAILPDSTPATLERFTRHAHYLVTDTRVDWDYDPDRAIVTTTFIATGNRPPKGLSGEDAPLQALYPHQWRQQAAPTTFTYASARGTMKVVESTVFRTEVPFPGLLPNLPLPDASSDALLKAWVRDDVRKRPLVAKGPAGETGAYWTGKGLQRLEVLAEIARQTGQERPRARFLHALRAKLEEWLDGSRRTPPKPPAFHLDETWHALESYPSEFCSAEEGNDRHFHYGYFIHAAAALAASEEYAGWKDKWGTGVDRLAADVANGRDGDPHHPFLRYFDAYAGHSWASGPAFSDPTNAWQPPGLHLYGNNEESSSEDLNLAIGLFFWDLLRDSTDRKNRGAFLYATLAMASEEYWFDRNGDVFPASYEPHTVGILWANGGSYDTWFHPSPTFVQGIQYLPFTPGILHLAARPDQVRLEQSNLRTRLKGEPMVWRDVHWMYEALADPEVALGHMNNTRWYTAEEGLSRAITRHWIRALAALGSPDPSIGADHPSFGVFLKGDARTLVAYNPSGELQTVRFFDRNGATWTEMVEVPARRMAWKVVHVTP